MLQAMVREFWKARHRHRWPRLVYHQDGSPTALPLQDMRGTLSTNTGTAYSGLRCTRKEFDQVAGMRVEGVSISATARLTGRSRKHRRAVARASLEERLSSSTGACCGTSISLSFRPRAVHVHRQQEQANVALCDHRGVFPLVGE
jgi:hypothetical protein